MEYYEQRHRPRPEHVQPRPLRGVPTRPILPTHRKTGGPRVRTPRPNLEADRDAAISSPEVGAVRTLPRKLRRQGDEFRRRGTHAAQSLVLFAYAGRLSPLPPPLPEATGAALSINYTLREPYASPIGTAETRATR